MMKGGTRVVMYQQFAYHQTMVEGPDISRLARTIGDATRIRMLALLTEGRALTAKELAYGAGVEPATATAHLRRLEGDGLLSSVAQGRHKYFRLASDDVAQLIESFMVVAPRPKSDAVPSREPIRVARFCYDHLAGELGTRLTAALAGRGVLAVQNKAYVVTRKGERWFASFGIDLPALRRHRRQFAYRCLDWSERKDHLAGALGTAVAQRLVVLGWIERKQRSRVVSVTSAGYRALKKEFGISLTPAA